MKVLLDETLDHRLRSYLSSFNVFTVTHMGWSGLKNGELLQKLILSGFTHFLTADRQLPYQQNEEKIINANISVIILNGANILDEHIRHLREIKSLLKKYQPGFVEIKYGNPSK